MKRKLLTILTFVFLVFGALTQKSLLDPIRGQAMSMPFLTSYIGIGILALIYSILFFCHKHINGIIHIHFAIAVQLLIIAYTIHKHMFYWDLREGNIPIDEWDSDYFPPIDLNYFIIIFFSVIIIWGCIRLLKIKANKKIILTLMMLVSTINLTQKNQSNQMIKQNFILQKQKMLTDVKKM